MKLASQLRRNIFALSVLQIVNYAVPLISVPYLVRVLHPAGFGLLAFAQAVILLFDIVTDYGFTLSITRTVAGCRNDREILSRTFWITVGAKLILMTGSAIVLAAIIILTRQSRETALLYWAAFLNVVGTALFPVWLFQGLEEMNFTVRAQALARVLTIPAIFLLVRRPSDYLIAAFIQGSVLIWATVFVLPAICKRIRVRPYVPSIRELVSAFRNGWHLFLTNLAGFAYSATTVVILGLVAGKAEVGYYSAAEKLIRAASALLGPFTQALYPHLTVLRAQSRDSALRLIRKSLSWVTVIGFTASVMTLCLAGPIGRIVFGAAFAPSINVLRCLSPLPFLYGLSSVFGNLTLIVFEIDSSMSRILSRCAAINALLSCGFSAMWGAVGAATATVLTTVVMTASMAFAAKRNQLTFWRTSPKPLPVAVLSLPGDP
ncbi:MAG: flippase [Bryobacteraceae bacterium]|jgi:PST family polysaccharide transporter